MIDVTPPLRHHATQPQRGWYKRNEIAITPWLFLAARDPVLLRSTSSIPIFQSFYISLYDWDGLGESDDYVGMENYERAAGRRRARSSRRSGTT